MNNDGHASREILDADLRRGTRAGSGGGTPAPKFGASIADPLVALARALGRYQASVDLGSRRRRASPSDGGWPDHGDAGPDGARPGDKRPRRAPSSGGRATGRRYAGLT